MLYSRRVLSGDFQVVCPWLLRDLINLGLWDDNMKNLIIAAGGSIQNIPTIPSELKAIYKTVWEVSQKAVIDLAADRGAFIDQSQSLNIHLANPSFSQLTSMHFYGWKRGLKTGMYYLRTKPAANAIQFTIDAATLKRESIAQNRSVTMLTCRGQGQRVRCQGAGRRRRVPRGAHATGQDLHDRVEPHPSVRHCRLDRAHRPIRVEPGPVRGGGDLVRGSQATCGGASRGCSPVQHREQGRVCYVLWLGGRGCLD